MTAEREAKTSVNQPERVLITGGAAGIGAAIVRRCIEAGYDPVVIDRETHRDVRSIKADLTDEVQTKKALSVALADGPITRLVNNVGVVFPASLAEQTLEEFDIAVALNLKCALIAMQTLLPGMQEAGFGRVVNMSSRAALGKELRSAYSATKAGLVGLTRVWALELGQYGITVNAIGPGPIRTELFEGANPSGSDRTRAIIEGVPVKRIGEPEDVAHSTAFFSTGKAASSPDRFSMFVAD